MDGPSAVEVAAGAVQQLADCGCGDLLLLHTFSVLSFQLNKLRRYDEFTIDL